ncbi:MAG: GIY-YIG nuclease family protein [Lachnospiraceae bacterium]|nr:GIY-YIG nuclease family protein [Lachnospiraceae bacterium]
MNDKKETSLYYTYILQCENGILYTGITTDYKRRLKEHKGEDGLLKGAKFTKSHKPEKIVALWKTDNRSDASKLETRIKKLKKSEKLELIKDNKMFKTLFSELLDCRNYSRVKV